MANVKGDSTTSAVPAVFGENTAAGDGVFGKGRRGVVGESDSFQGVFGKSIENAGVVGESTKLHGVFGVCHNPHGAGVFGTNDQVGGFGVQGINASGDGVIGTGRRGVVGESETFQGVFGRSRENAGIVGESRDFHAVFGVSLSKNNGGVIGINESGGWGVIGRSPANTGVSGESTTGRGVHGISETGEGVHGQTRSRTVAAVVAINHAPDGTGAAIFAEKKGDNGHAGFFVGNVHVTRNVTVDGDISCDAGDCAEDFDVADVGRSQPGTVMVLGDDGALYPSESAYDKRVVGVVSGAGDYRSAIVLDKRRSSVQRKPIALLGKVFCKADASSAPIGVGDLLTTSEVPGHAMKAVDPATAFGAVIGKALRPLAAGQGLIPILVTLQ